MNKNQRGFITLGLLANYRLFLYGGIIAVILAAAGYVYYSFYNLEKEKQKIEKDNAVLKTSVETLTKTNEVNTKTIEQLTKDKKQSDEIIRDLRAQRIRNTEEMNKLRYSITTRVKVDPSLDGPISPILRDTILQLQNKREGVSK